MSMVCNRSKLIKCQHFWPIFNWYLCGGIEFQCNGSSCLRSCSKWHGFLFGLECLFQLSLLAHGSVIIAAYEKKLKLIGFFKRYQCHSHTHTHNMSLWLYDFMKLWILRDFSSLSSSLVSSFSCNKTKRNIQIALNDKKHIPETNENKKIEKQFTHEHFCL